MVEDGTESAHGATAVEPDGPKQAQERRRRDTALGLLGFVVALVGFGTVVYGSVSVVEARELDEYDFKPALLGLVIFAVGLAVLQASFREKPVPWVSLAIKCVCISLVLGIALLSVADAFLPRPQKGEECEDRQPPPSKLRNVTGQPIAFSFPEENAGTTGIRISMGRGRPAQEEATQMLVRSVSTSTATTTTTTTTTTVPGQQTRPTRASRAASRAARLGPRALVQVELSELRREDGARMADGTVSAWAHMVNSQNMELVVCVAPRAADEEVDAGAYTGVLSIIDPRVARVDVPVRVEMQFNRWPVLVTLLIGTLVVASFILYNGTRQLSGRTAALNVTTLEAFGHWLQNNPVAIGTGVVAAVAIFANQYLADSFWSGSSAEVFALIGAVSAAFLGAATVAATVDPTRRPPDPDEAKRATGVVPKTGAGPTATEVPPAVEGPAPPMPTPTPVVVVPDVPVDDDDTLGHPDDHDMPGPDEVPDEPDPTIPDDSEITGAGSPALVEAEDSDIAPDDPELDVPEDEPLAPAPASGDIPLDDDVEPAAGSGDIPSDDPQAGG